MYLEADFGRYQLLDEVTLAVATARGVLRWSVPELRAGWETSIGVAMKRPGIG